MCSAGDPAEAANARLKQMRSSPTKSSPRTRASKPPPSSSINFKRPSQQWAANQHLDRRLGGQKFVPKVGRIGENNAENVSNGRVAVNQAPVITDKSEFKREPPKREVQRQSSEGGLMSRISGLVARPGLGGYFGGRRTKKDVVSVSIRARGATNGDKIRENLQREIKVQPRPKIEHRGSTDRENLRGSVIRRNAEDLLARFDRRNENSMQTEELERDTSELRRVDHHRSDTFLLGYPSDDDDNEEDDDFDHHQSCADFFARQERRKSDGSMSLEDIFEEEDDEPHLLPSANPATMSLPATLFTRSEAGITRAPFGLDELDSCDGSHHDESFEEEEYMASMPCVDVREYERGDATRSAWRPWTEEDDGSLSIGDEDGETYLSCSLPSWPTDTAKYYERARAA